jgi:Na+-transporting methylmalonyl-CoA/oxaloacetate decarboxylase gamma subunit
MASKKILIDIRITDSQAVTAVNRTTEAVDKLAKSQERLTTRTAKGKATSGLNNAILLETSRLASDASFGLQGMANNIGQIASLMQVSAANSGGFINALKDVWRSIMGVGGVMIALQLLISFLPKIAKAFGSAKDEVDAFNKELENVTRTAEQQMRALTILTNSIDTFDLSGKALVDTVKLLSSEFPEFKEAFENLNELDDESVKNLINDFKTLQQTRRDILETEFRLRQEGIEGTKKEIELRGKLKDLLRLRNSLLESFKSTNQDVLDTESDLSDKIDFNTEAFLKRFLSILKLSKARSIDVDEEVEKDNFMLQFKTFSMMQRIDLMEQEALAELDSYYERLDNDLFYQQEREKIEAYFQGLREQRMMSELEVLAEATAGFAHLFGERTALGKGFAVATATIDTFVAGGKVLKDETIPTLLKPVAMAGIIATGLGNVREIMKVDTSGRIKAPSAASGGGNGMQVQAPDFNVVGASETSQLGMALGRTQREQKVNLVWDDLQNFNNTAERTVEVAGI